MNYQRYEVIIEIFVKKCQKFKIVVKNNFTFKIQILINKKKPVYFPNNNPPKIIYFIS